MGSKQQTSQEYLGESSETLKRILDFEKELYVHELNFFTFLVEFNKKLMINSEKIKKVNLQNFLELLQFKPTGNIDKLFPCLESKNSIFVISNPLKKEKDMQQNNMIYFNCLNIKYLFFVLLFPYKYNTDKSNIYFDKVNIFIFNHKMFL